MGTIICGQTAILPGRFKPQRAYLSINQPVLHGWPWSASINHQSSYDHHTMNIMTNHAIARKLYVINPPVNQPPYQPPYRHHVMYMIRDHDQPLINPPHVISCHPIPCESVFLDRSLWRPAVSAIPTLGKSASLNHVRAPKNETHWSVIFHTNVSWDRL